MSEETFTVVAVLSNGEKVQTPGQPEATAEAYLDVIKNSPGVREAYILREVHLKCRCK